jgi:hypothetical protein
MKLWGSRGWIQCETKKVGGKNKWRKRAVKINKLLLLKPHHYYYYLPNIGVNQLNKRKTTGSSGNVKHLVFGR